MELLFDAARSAFRIVISFDPEFYHTVFLSLRLAFLSTLLAALAGVPLGFFIGTVEFRGKKLVSVVFNTLYSLPTVIVGLMVYIFISRSGPLGFLNILYTPMAIVIGQSILIFPLITALTIATASAMDKRVIKTCLALGGNLHQARATAFLEYKSSFVAAIIAGFGRAFGEIGVSMMLGGNIRGYTRNITTTIALETAKGEFELGIASGLVLLLVACLISVFFQLLQRGK